MNSIIQSLALNQAKKLGDGDIARKFYIDLEQDKKFGAQYTQFSFGENKQKLNLQISTQAQIVAVNSKDSDATVQTDQFYDDSGFNFEADQDEAFYQFKHRWGSKSNYQIYSFNGDFYEDSVELNPSASGGSDHVDTVYDGMKFFSMKKSLPNWETNGNADDISVDGYLGLKSSVASEETSDNSKNFLDQITNDGSGSENTLIDKKMFSIYIAEDNDSSYSSILFGGKDDEAFLEGTPKTEFQLDNDYKVPLTTFSIGDTNVPIPEGQTKVLFDPGMPYIYVPQQNGDFKTKVGNPLKELFPTAWLVDHVCEEKNGNCFLKKTCEEARQNEDPDGSFKMTLTDETGATMDFEIPKEKMLIDDNLDDEQQTPICRFPFFMNEHGTDWIIGSIISKDYYSVFDLSSPGDGVTLTMGLKNPKYEKKPDVPGGNDDDKPAKASHTEVVVIILAIVIVIATLALLYICIQRKKNASTFDFNNKQDYGAIKQGKSANQQVVRQQMPSESDF